VKGKKDLQETETRGGPLLLAVGRRSRRRGILRKKLVVGPRLGKEAANPITAQKAKGLKNCVKGESGQLKGGGQRRAHFLRGRDKE